MGQIRLKRMRFHTCHGALPHEQHVAQEFWVDVELELPLTAAGLSDRLADTINYGRVARIVEDTMMGPPVKLLETLAYRMYSRIVELDDRIGQVSVHITKVDPPIGVPSGGVEVVVDGRD